MSQLRNRNIVVFGISADTVATHRDFARSEQLNFALLSDTKKQTIAAYGALGPGGSLLRVTYIIGPDGLIHGIDRNVNSQFAKRGGTLVTRHGANLSLLLSDWRSHPGASVPNFFLRNFDGRTVTPQIGERKASVIFLLSVREAKSQIQAASIDSLSRNPIYQDVAFLGIDPQQNETETDLKSFAAERKLAFPIARDIYHEVIGHLDARQTPMAYVLDRQGKVVYRGVVSRSGAGAGTTDYVRAALDATLMGRPTPVTESLD